MENNFSELKQDLIKWIKNWYFSNATNENMPVVVGLSGGAISNVMVCLLCTALGPHRVHGVIMRGVNQVSDDEPAVNICNYVKIKFVRIPIFPSVNALKNVMTLDGKVRLSEQAINNIPARMRMVALYAYSQSVEGFVVSTQTLSDMFIGHNTIYGDGCGDFAPFANLTREEIMKIGDELGMDKKYLEIIPDDGLPASIPDEDKLQFKYKELDTYIRTGIIENVRSKALIDKLHSINSFKRLKMASFNPGLYVFNP